MAMLLTQNAVHSAMYLILNFACVAFLYLMLDAPFLALVQVAVYAGAIMVLFLFVIMLLGAERTMQEVRQFKWLAPITLTLSMSFLIAFALAFSSSGIDDQPVPPRQPMVRVVNGTPDFPMADIFIDGELFIDDVAFGGLTDDNELRFEDLQPGDYTLGIADGTQEDARALPLGSFSIEQGQALTLVTYGIIGSDVNPTFTAVEQDVAYYDDDAGRVTIVNAYVGSPISVVDAGSDRILDADDLEIAPPIVTDLAVGQATEATLFRTGDKDWVFVNLADIEAEETLDNNVIARPEFDVQSASNNLLVLVADQEDSALIPVALPIITETLPQFGSPEAIGNALFTTFVLPFELVAMLLLAAMVGAIVLTQRGDIKPKPGRPTRRKVSRPLTSVIAAQTGHEVTQEDDDDQALAKPTVEQPEPSGD